jgi:zinc transporter ZupT
MSTETTLVLIGAVVVPAIVSLWGLPRWMPAYASGLLVGLALFVLLPEVGGGVGVWPFAAGLVFAWCLDRYVHPSCTGCSGDSSWRTMLPLWGALGVHSLADGALLDMARPGSAASWLLVLHRLPEGLATAAVLRSAQPHSKLVWVQVVLLQVATLVGFFGGTVLSSRLLEESYGFAGGAMLFLGVHSMHHHGKESRLSLAQAGAGLLSMWMIHLI